MARLSPVEGHPCTRATLVQLHNDLTPSTRLVISSSPLTTPAKASPPRLPLAAVVSTPCRPLTSAPVLPPGASCTIQVWHAPSLQLVQLHVLVRAALAH